MLKKRLLLIITFIALTLALITILLTRHTTRATHTWAALQGDPLPNLVPQTPSGWSHPIVPAFITGTHALDTLYAGLGVPTYFDWAILNASDTPVTANTVTCLTLDGNPLNTWNVPAYAPNSYITLEDWAYALPASSTFTVTLTADCTNLVPETDETDNTLALQFTWLPYNGIVFSNKQAFDKCDIASTSDMRIWWNQSPYWETNIYIGGSARACPNTGLTDNWVRNVIERGWNVIPTWVGPQAPCTSYISRFSWNPGTAREQGRREADAALLIAHDLGLTPPGSQTILYYDLEAYPNNALCREAAGAFLDGWTARLHERGHRSGIYGAGCGSYPTDWPALPHPPDDVWLAHWIYSTYNPNATVWDVACVPNSLWANNQRIRQYAGGHNETWGGVTFNIDSNIALGHVAGINPRTNLQPEPPPRDIQLLPNGEGWLIQGHQLLWKTKTDWKDITPTEIPAGTPLTAFFLNPTTGWAAIASPPGPNGVETTLTILTTPDQGQTWHPTAPLPHFAPNGLAAAWIQFMDAQTGWVSIKHPTSSNFSLGDLYRTTDGGTTWEPLPLPLGAPVRFIDAQTGWIAGGPTGTELYHTTDSGQTWTPVPRPYPNGLVDLPTFVNGTGILPITFPGDRDHARILFLTSTDHGQTWHLTAEIPLPNGLSTDVPIPTAILDANTWLLANPNDGTLTLITQRGQMLEALSTTLPGPIKLQFPTLSTGWVLNFTGTCTGEKGTEEFQCSFEQGLLSTENTGETWNTLTP